MAEPLKNSYGPDIPRKIASLISQVHSNFPSALFLDDALNGYEALELMPRGRHIAKALKKHLPSDYRKAVRILVLSMGPKLESTESFGMSPFLYMPYAFFIAENGLEFWSESMDAQYKLTQRFTAEFSIRPFLIHHREKTLKRLDEWTADPSAHVRRLVSEGTRPRLPWAMRLPAFQKDPTPVLGLLEKLKNDPELYVRRSVANNLNDIGKDNPHFLLGVAQKWTHEGGEEKRWIVRHALRSLIKAGHPNALAILGYGAKTPIEIKKKSLQLSHQNGKKAVRVSFSLQNKTNKTASVLVDFQIHYVKANGRTSPKVFKLKETQLAPGDSLVFSKKISLDNMTTRKHFPGRHRVDALVNGNVMPMGSFLLR